MHCDNIFHMTNTKTNTNKKHGAFLMPKGFDAGLHITMILLSLFGIAMVGSASMGLSVGNNTYLLISLAKQTIYVLAGFFAMTFLANHFKMSFLKSSAFSSLIILTCILLVVCLGFGGYGGAKAWIIIPLGITEVSIQPSEFAKIVAILIVAAYTADISKRFKSSYEMLKKPLIFLLLMIFIVAVLQSDFGSAVVIFLISCVCLLIPNHPQMRKFEIFLRVCFWLVVILAIFILSPYGEKIIESIPEYILKEYQKNRFISAIDPFKDRYGVGYQLIKGLVSFASGGFFGRGFGNSIQKYMDFPAANTDYILAIIVEELGFVGFFVLFALYGIIIFKLLSYALKMKSEKGKVILVGSAMYLLFHMFFNIGGVTGLIPLTGIPLLVVSAGGSSTMSFLACIGICQAVIALFRRGELQ